MAIRRYHHKISGPIRDRIDVTQAFRPLRKAFLKSGLGEGESSATVAARVAEARARQAYRLRDTPWQTNGEVSGPYLRKRLPLPDGATMIDDAVKVGQLSTRGVDKVLRLAWTLADLSGRDKPVTEDVAVAVAMRRGGAFRDVDAGGLVNRLPERTARMALCWAIEGGEPAVAEAATVDGGAQTWERVLAGEFGDAALERAGLVDIERLLTTTESSGARFVIPGDGEWPESLTALRYCDAINRRGGIPFGLWLRGPGRLAELMTRSVSIVGARACTEYGSGIATDMAADLGEAGYTVVSGGAYGIDTAAHRGALVAERPTVVVFANGVDVGYPKGNGAIFRRIADDGLLVSELPPGTPPSRMRFLARNRLIAALSLGTVVVEAALRSGARNTATWALECQRQLMAVPGPVSSSWSQAPHLLIRNGQATLVTGAADVLELVAPAGEHTVAHRSGPTRATDDFDAVRMAVYEAVPARRAVSPGEIALVAGVSMPVCLAQLAELEALGFVEATEYGWRVLPKREAG